MNSLDETARALQRLENDGSDMTKPMEIDFFVSVPSETAGKSIAIEARQLGYEAKIDQDTETGEWTCYCTKTLVPEYSEITKIERQLDMISQSHGGYIDGFGSFGNAEWPSLEGK